MAQSPAGAMPRQAPTTATLPGFSSSGSSRRDGVRQRPARRTNRVASRSRQDDLTEVKFGVSPSVLGIQQLEFAHCPVLHFVYPWPGIALAVVAPAPVLTAPNQDRVGGSPGWRSRPLRLRCAAVNEAGDTLVAPVLSFDGDANRVFAELSDRLLQRRRMRSVPPDAGRHNEIPNDLPSLNDLGCPHYWNLYAHSPKMPSREVERWALAMRRPGDPGTANDPVGVCIDLDGVEPFVTALAAHLDSLVELLIAHLRPSLRSQMLDRPDLSIGIIQAVTDRCDASSQPEAPRNAAQAMRTQPAPVLRWLVEFPGDGLMDTVLAGRSLPAAICGAASVPRAVVRHLVRCARGVPDLPVRDFTAVLKLVTRLPRANWPVHARQWQAVASQVRTCLDAAERLACNGQIVDAALLAGGQYLMLGPQGLIIDTPGFWLEVENLGPSLAPEAVGVAMLEVYSALSEQRQDDTVSPLLVDTRKAAALRLAQAFGTLDIATLGAAWFALLPKWSCSVGNGLRVQLLQTVHEVVGLGRSMHNCLRSLRGAMIYVLRGCLLLSVSDVSGQTLAVMSVHASVKSHGVQLGLDQLLGPRNSPVSVDFERAAEEAVDRLARSSAALMPYLVGGERIEAALRRMRAGVSQERHPFG